MYRPRQYSCSAAVVCSLLEFAIGKQSLMSIWILTENRYWKSFYVPRGQLAQTYDIIHDYMLFILP